MSALRLFSGNNHNVLELRALKDNVTGAVETGATVTVTIRDAAGVEVTGQTWPKTLTEVVESPLTGLYRGTLDATLAITSNNEFKATVSATSSGGIKSEWVCDVLPAVRGIDD